MPPRTRSPLYFVVALIVGVASVALAYFSAVAMGLGRHGASPASFAWLHTEWWGTLGAHSAHAQNLAMFAVGLAGVMVSLALAVRASR